MSKFTKRSKAQLRNQSTADNIVTSNYFGVEVVHFDEKTKSFYLIESALQQLLSQPDVANNPVAIYSIAGKRRQGKSFLLNLFFCYLLKNRSDDWIDDIDLSNRVFEWKGGDEKCTKGIWLLNKPFVIKTPAHGEISVFLMDTHGTFDPESDNTMNTFITTFSTLLCSYQIFNVNHEITADYFQTLELFTGYGEKCQKMSRTAQSAKPFQNLMFLVRNWCLDMELKGLSGGKKHLTKRLSINAGQSKEVQSNRKYISGSFEKICCFLLRHPGGKVATAMSSSSLTVSDINAVFLNEVNELAVLLFGDPSQIKVKMLNNKVLTGVEVVNLINRYWSVFKDGKMPSLPGLVQAISEAEILNEMRNLLKIYFRKIEKMSQENGQDASYINEAKLMQRHSELKQEALNKLKSLSFAGSKDLAEKYCSELDHDLEQSFQRFQQINKLKKAISEAEILNEMRNLLKIYFRKIEKMSQENGQDASYINEAKLMQRHSELKQEALNKLKSLSFAGSKDLAEKYCSELDHDLEQSFQRFQQINKLKKRELLFRIDKEAMNAQKNCQSYLEETLGDHQIDVVNLQRSKKISTQKTLAEFDLATKDWDSELVKMKRNKLEEELDVVFDNVLRKAQQNQEREENQAMMKLEQAFTAYKIKMHEKCESGPYMEPTKIGIQHRNYEVQLSSWFCENTNEMHHHKVKELHERMDEECERILNENKKKEPLICSIAVHTISYIATGEGTGAATEIAISSAILYPGARCTEGTLGALIGGLASLL